MSHPWVSLIPVGLTLLAAILTKRIITSLALGLGVGAVLKTGSLLLGIVKTGDYLAGSLGTVDSASIVLFLFLFGALAEMFRLSGGIKGFSRVAGLWVKSERGILSSVWAATPFSFLDCCFHVIATGTITRPLAEKAGISRERLAFVINVSSSQLIALIPIATTYVGYITGLTAAAIQQEGIGGSAYELYVKSIPFNFFSIGMVGVSLAITFAAPALKRWRFGGGNAETGVHSKSEAEEQCTFEEHMPARVANLLVPLVCLLALTIFFLWYTGQAPGRSFMRALEYAQFEKALLLAVLATMVLTAAFYLLQGIPPDEIESHLLSGGTEMLPPIILLILGWSLAHVTRDLGFGRLIAAVGPAVPRAFVPAAIFVIGGITSYFVGSSWATWALIIPIALPLAHGTGASLPLALGAALAGGSIGDCASPLGETPILTAAIMKVPLMDLIQSVVPYAVLVAAASLGLFVLAQAILG